MTTLRPQAKIAQGRGSLLAAEEVKLAKISEKQKRLI
jgi:hypothetical protein